MLCVTFPLQSDGSSKLYSVVLLHLTTSYDKSISYVVLPALPKAAVNENEQIGYFELGNIMIWSRKNIDIK